MKKTIFISLLLVSFSIQVIAQENTSNKKIVKTTFWVNGQCDMCQTRIEKAALKTKGVKMATWHIESNMLSVIYNTRQCSVNDIKQNIANVGHDTKGFRAKDKVYENLHSCCKYEREPLADTKKK